MSPEERETLHELRTKQLEEEIEQRTKGTDQKDALRYNEGKSPMHLLPMWVLEEIAEHYGRGAKKYSDWNWLQGGSTNVCFGAMLRHISAWQQGEDLDDLGSHHMAAVAWNAIALLHGYRTGVDRDDRPKIRREA